MEIVKKTDQYQIIKKRSGRYGIRGADRKWITGDEKVKILVAEGLIKSPAPREDEPSEEAPPQEASSQEAPAEEASAEANEEAPDAAPEEEKSQS